MFNKVTFNTTTFNVNNGAIVFEGDVYNSRCRYISCYLEIYFDGLDNTPVTIDNINVDSIELLEEVRPDSERIFGAISSNELNISFANIDRKFSPSNINSPYYGKILPKTPIKAYLCIEDGGQTYTTCLGTFYSNSWDDQNGLPIVKVSSYDKLYFTGPNDFAGTEYKIQYKGEWFIEVFTAMGLTADDYEIANIFFYEGQSLEGWLSAGSNFEALGTLAEACGAYVYMNRSDKVKVIPLDITTIPTRKITEYDQIIAASNPTSYYDVYSRININVYQYKWDIHNEDKVLSIPQVYANSNSQDVLIQRCKFEKPVARITDIQCVANVINNPILITKMTHTAENITLYLRAYDWSGSSDINVYAYYVQVSNFLITQQNTNLQQLIGDKVYNIDNKLLSESFRAQNLSESINLIASNPRAIIKVQIRGSANITAGDTIVVSDNLDHIGEHKVFIYRSKLTLLGGLAQEIEGYILS